MKPLPPVSLRSITTDPEPADRIVPDGQGPFMPVAAGDIAVFNDIVCDEVDSAFSSTICCCDFCYDDFKAHWPDVAFRESDFQQNGMGAFWFVDYSRLPGIYTPAEISTLRHFVQCERCTRYGAANIWVYEHRFSDSRAIESAIDELLTLGSRTPFLLLDHPFARRVLAQIRDSATRAAKLPIGVTLYRARTAADIVACGQTPDGPASYGVPPAARVGEGRFNHAGHPMLYVASTPATAAAELGAPGEPCHVGHLRLDAPIAVLDLADIDEEVAGYDLMQALASSALLTAPRTGDGWLRREYVFSRFVADCALDAGFDAIRYGSTKQVDGANYVLLSGAVVGSFTLLGHEELAGLSPAHRY